MIYGPHSPQLDQVETLRKQTYEGSWHELAKTSIFVQGLYGYLSALKSDIEQGRIVSVQSEARGEVLGDLLVSARKALDEGQKNVAAVLACAALEDTLKRYGSDRGLNVQDKTMPTVVNALRTAGVIRGNQKALLSEFVKTRNSAFHAQWDEIDVCDVEDIARFTEHFLANEFSSPIAADSPADPPVEA